MTQRRTQLDIGVVTQEAERLPTIAAAWATLDPEDRVAFRAEWHDLMDVFVHLVRAYEVGELAARDVPSLRSLVAALVTALPMMEQMRLRQPDADMLARVRLAAAS
jgi:hypothetical protein